MVGHDFFVEGKHFCSMNCSYQRYYWLFECTIVHSIHRFIWQNVKYNYPTLFWTLFFNSSLYLKVCTDLYTVAASELDIISIRNWETQTWNFLFNWFQCTAEIWLSRYKLLFNWLILSYWKVEPWRHIRLDTWFDFFETVLSFYFDSDNSLTELCEANRLSFPPLILILFLVHKQCCCVTND